MTSLYFIDKTYPANHSFVDDFLLNTSFKDERIIYFEEGDRTKLFSINGSIKVKCILNLRAGLGRFTNFFKVLNEIRQYQKNGSLDKVFIRNCPIYLLAAKLCRPEILIYQSSFDHELDVRFIKRIGSQILHNILKNRVTHVTSVSSMGLKRLHRRYPNTSDFVIPLCADYKVRVSPINRKSTRFVYLGKTTSNRSLDVVVNSLSKLILSSKIDFTIIGTNANDFQKNYPKLNEELVNKITFASHRSRYEAMELLNEFDIGISCVPNSAENIEMSPTKLSEYIAAGLAVLASNNVPSQVDLISENRFGVLTEFNKDEIEKAAESLIGDIPKYKKNARKSRDIFHYKRYYELLYNATLRSEGAAHGRAENNIYTH